LYESSANKRRYSSKIKDLSLKKYKQILWGKMKDMLEIADYNVAKIKQELLYENEDRMLSCR
jgi:hypothetical protein